MVPACEGGYASSLHSWFVRCELANFPIICSTLCLAYKVATHPSDRPKIGHQPAAAAFSFCHAGRDLHRCAPQSRAPNRRTSERDFYLRTPGNNHYLVNYEIVPRDDLPTPPTTPPKIPTGSYDAFDWNLDNFEQERISSRFFYTSAPKNSVSAASSDWHAWEIRDAKVEEKYRQNLRVPFWIVKVPPLIIDNHGGIWSDNSMALMAAIYRFHYPKRVPGKEKPPTLPSRPDIHHEKLYRSVQ